MAAAAAGCAWVPRYRNTASAWSAAGTTATAASYVWGPRRHARAPRAPVARPGRRALTAAAEPLQFSPERRRLTRRGQPPSFGLNSPEIGVTLGWRPPSWGPC